MLKEFLILILLIFLISAIIIYFIIKKRKQNEVFSEIGRQGEDALFHELSALRGRFRYKRLLRNLYLPGYREGTTAEIDLVMICKSGIYVFENKNYTGTVMGDEDAREWYQANVNGNSFYFYNPIAQNRSHVNCLMRALRIDNPEMVKSVIVFNRSCDFRRVRIYSDDFILCKSGKIKKAVKKLSRKNRKLLHRKDILYLYEKLEPYTAATKKIKKEHIRQVRELS